MASWVFNDFAFIRKIRGLAVPRIFRSPDACQTCRRHGFRCNWGLPTCVTCDKNGYECIQPLSTVGYEEYIRGDDNGKQSITQPESAGKAKRRNNKNKKKKKNKIKNKSKTEPKIEAKTETTKIKIKSSYDDDGIVGYGWDLKPIFRTRDMSIPAPEKIAIHECTRLSAPLPASGSASESASESGAGTESASASASVSATVTESASASGSASSEPAFESEFVNRIKRHMYKYQQRELEHTHRYVGRSDSTSSDDVDKDHDYAVYYDYDYDTDPEVLRDIKDFDPSTLGFGPIMATVTKRLDTFDMFLVKNSWKGPGEPPLRTRIDDYLGYAARNHLEERLPLPLPLLASCDYTASDSLFYYEKRPANCGVAGLPDINPVNPKLVRLGYANPLALQLVIAQRANHREVSSAILNTGESAERFLKDAIAQFGPKIDSYLSGSEDEMPALFVASTVIALVERARLDQLSQAYNHPTAAGAILNNLHSLKPEEIFINMPECLIEHYMHTVSFACVATNPITAAAVPFINAPQLLFVDNMTRKGYVGKLCGSWLDILATIPHIFRLGSIVYRHKLGISNIEDAPGVYLNFGDIEDRLMASAAHKGGERTDIIDKVAVLFKIAAMLYLWSLLDEPLLQDHDAVTLDEDAMIPAGVTDSIGQDEARRQRDKEISEQIIRQAEGILPTIMLEDNFNLALCWPMLIIGCFTKDKGTEKFIEKRLIAIAEGFGVGNSLETLFILKHVWSLPMDKRSPLKIWQYIQDSRCRECTCPKCIPLLFESKKTKGVTF